MKIPEGASAVIAFVAARLDEEEQLARDAYGAPWDAAVGGMVHVSAAAIRDDKWQFGKLGYVASVEREADRQHIAYHDPARVLADVQAKRDLLHIASHSFKAAAQPHQDPKLRTYYQGAANTLLFAIGRIARQYNTHPDWNPDAWTTEGQPTT